MSWKKRVSAAILVSLASGATLARSREGAAITGESEAADADESRSRGGQYASMGAARTGGGPRGVTGSTFTFQGRLMDNSAPASGVYDLEFQLFDDDGAAAGNPSIVAQEDVLVTDGIFTVELGFGPSAFDGQGRSVEVRVRPGASTDAYTALAPRQRLTATPHALSLPPAIRIQPGPDSPNVIEGLPGNAVTADVRGAAIGGGGSTATPDSRNLVTDDFGTIGGGEHNQAGDAAGTVSDARWATVAGGVANRAGALSAIGGGGDNSAMATGATIPGGESNVASGDYSFAAGRHASALHRGSFVFADAPVSGETLASTAVGQFLIRAAGGVGIGTNAPARMLHIRGSAGLFRIETTADAVNPTVELKDSSPGQKRLAAVNFLRSDNGVPGQLSYNMDINEMAFRVNNSERMRIDDAGNVGIGDTTPEARLDVVADPNGLSVAITGDTPHATGTGVLGMAVATSGGTRGVHGLSASSSGSGVFGEATSATGSPVGVRGNAVATGGIGVVGRATALSGSTTGVFGESLSPNGIGVRGVAPAATGASIGVRGEAGSTAGIAVSGLASAPSGSTSGVFGQSQSSIGVGVRGFASSTTGSNTGVLGQSNSNTGRGVSGVTTSPTGGTAGVHGESWSSTGIGVSGLTSSTTGGGTAVFGEARAPSGTGVSGLATSTTGNTRAVFGEARSQTGVAVYGLANAHSGDNIGVEGVSLSSTGKGVYALANSPSGHNYGVFAETTSDQGIGVYSTADSETGVTRGVVGVTFSGSNGAVGVYGSAPMGTGATVGVVGQSGSPSGYGGEFINQQIGGIAIRLFKSSTFGDFISAVRSTGDTEFRVTGGGSVFADGSYNCGLSSSCFNSGTGADLAERIDATESLEAGDVVSIDPRHVERFRLSRERYSPLVAGVVSTAPAMTMGNNDLAENDGIDRMDVRPLLALVGRVPVKASAENGPIRIGDLLVSSATPGHAMRAGANPPAGTVIGKALEGLDRGTGRIRMLVTLQ